MSPKRNATTTALVLFSAILAGSGCVTTNTKSRRYARSTPMVSATLRRHDEQITNLTFQVNQIKEKNTALVKTINALNKRLLDMSNENADLKNRVATLSLALKQEKSARVAEMNTLMKEVAKQTAAALAAAARTRAAALAASSSRKGGRRPAGPVGKGQFYVHTVESGATLGAIAKAYKVTVSEIKRANRLTSDNIRVGQKLYIPKR